MNERQTWVPIVAAIVFLAPVGGAIWGLQWGPFHGLSGEAWLRFWAAVVPALFASLAALVAWLSLQQNRNAERRSREADRRGEFWSRLEGALKLCISENLLEAQWGSDLLTFIYEDMVEDEATKQSERELMAAMIRSAQEELEVNRRKARRLQKHSIRRKLAGSKHPTAGPAN